MPEKMKELCNKKVAFIEQSRAILDQDNVSSDDKAKADKFLDQAIEVDKDIARMRKQSELESSLDQKVENFAFTHDLSKDEVLDKANQYNNVFDKYMRFGNKGMTNDEMHILNQGIVGDIKNAQSTGVDADGGYTVPTEFYGQLEKAKLDFSGVRQTRATILRTSDGRKIEMPTSNDVSNKGALIAENAADADQDVAFGQKFLESHTITSKMVPISLELLQDTGVNIHQIIAEMLGERIGRKENELLTVGTNSSQHEGVVTGSALGLTAASVNALTMDELMDLFYSIDPAYRMNSEFMMNDTTFKALSKLKNGNGDYLIQSDVTKGAENRLFGKSVFVNNDMGEMTAGEKSVLFGDFSKYHIRDVQGASLLQLRERFAEKRQVAFVAFTRSDAVLLNAGTNPIKHLIQAAS